MAPKLLARSKVVTKPAVKAAAVKKLDPPVVPEEPSRDNTLPPRRSEFETEWLLAAAINALSKMDEAGKEEESDEEEGEGKGEPKGKEEKDRDMEKEAPKQTKDRDAKEERNKSAMPFWRPTTDAAFIIPPKETTEPVPAHVVDARSENPRHMEDEFTAVANTVDELLRMAADGSGSRADLEGKYETLLASLAVSRSDMRVRRTAIRSACEERRRGMTEIASLVEQNQSYSETMEEVQSDLGKGLVRKRKVEQLHKVAKEILELKPVAEIQTESMEKLRELNEAMETARKKRRLFQEQSEQVTRLVGALGSWESDREAFAAWERQRDSGGSKRQGERAKKGKKEAGETVEGKSSSELISSFISSLSKPKQAA